jgi:hypothetical protein
MKVLVGILLGSCFVTRIAAAEQRVAIEPSAFRIVERDSGPVNYYSVVREGGLSFLRSHYRPPWKTSVVGWQMPEAGRETASRLSWSWRARALPAGGDECSPAKSDSAASVYATWKRGLRYYTLKYSWTARGTVGATCARKRNPFVAQDTVILRVGPPLDSWQHEKVDLRAEFRKHFEDGDPKAGVPNFVGVGILTDGDQTQSESRADIGSFVVVY